MISIKSTPEYDFKHDFINFQMMDFLARGYNNIREKVGERDKMIDIQEVVKLAADDGVVTYEEIRENLRR